MMKMKPLLSINSFTVYTLYQFMSSPIDIIQFGLTLTKPKSLDLLVYYDANYASCLDDKCSIEAFHIYFGGCLVSWKSSKKRLYLKVALTVRSCHDHGVN